ncbi:MAG: TetR/AcrR family transcriptional regulator, partial [Pseudomonadota bacterium]|nr:TetR/AcrR family transcriptional regulator [Pseudomonadota bacterium]
SGLALVREVGVEAVSLRQLAERVGVSTPALYHHFKNKQELLFALGEASVDLFQVELDQVIRQAQPTFSIEDFVLAYVRFAIENPELYELMFGRQMWHGAQDSEFHGKAKQSFRRISEHMLRLQQGGKLPSHVNPLRLAQVGWATLHGLCRMYNDGLAFAPETIEEIARYACRLLHQAVLAEAQAKATDPLAD